VRGPTGRSLAVCALLLFSSAAQARDLVVPTQYGDIPQAVAAAAAGDHILVHSGTYNGTVVVSGADSLTIEGVDTGDGHPVVAAGSHEDVFHVRDSQEVLIQNFRVVNAGTGFRIDGGQTEIVIAGNEISNTETAIRMRGGSGHWIAGNTIETKLDTAIRVHDTDDLAVTDNTIVKAGGHGVRIRESRNVTIDNNQIFESLRDGIRVFKCEDVSIGQAGLGNTSSRNRQSGIRVRGSSNVSIETNLTNANRRYGVRTISTGGIASIAALTDAGNTGQCNTDGDFAVDGSRLSGPCNATTTTTSTSTTTTVPGPPAK